MFRISVKRNKHKNQEGFTLLEMMVVIVIFSILSTIGMFNFRKFNSNTRLDNLAYDIALKIRSAQVAGISGASFIQDQSVESLFSDSSNNSSEAIGLHFDYDYSRRKFTDTIVLFQDSIMDSGNMLRTFTSNDRTIDELRIMTTDFIDGICSPATERACNNDGVGDGEIKDNVAVSFLRPNPDPMIKKYTDSSTSVTSVRGSIAIRLRDPRNGSIKYIIVEPTGQIKVSDSF